jgi:fumarate hydratase class II
MKVLTIAGIPTMLVLCVGMAIGQDAAHDVDKAATKTGHAVKHATKKVGKATKTGAKDVGHGAEVTAKDAGKGVKTGTEKNRRRR